MSSRGFRGFHGSRGFLEMPALWYFERGVVFKSPSRVSLVFVVPSVKNEPPPS